MSQLIGIIGATGMLGQHAVNAALADGHKVRVIHRKSSDLSKLHCRDDPRISTSIADLDDRKTLQNALKGLDAVMNCAGYYPTAPRPLEDELDIARSQMANFLAAVAGSGEPKALYLGAAIALPKAAVGIADERQVTDQPPEDKTAYVQVKWLMDKIGSRCRSGRAPRGYRHTVDDFRRIRLWTDDRCACFEYCQTGHASVHRRPSKCNRWQRCRPRSGEGLSRRETRTAIPADRP